MVANPNSIMFLVACLCYHLASSTRRNKLDNRKDIGISLLVLLKLLLAASLASLLVSITEAE